MVALFRHRARATQPSAPAAPAHDEDEIADYENHLRATARDQLWAGFSTRHDVETAIVELAEDEQVIPAARAREIADEEWAARVAELAEPTDREPTDDVRVATAFAGLRRAGVIATMNLGFDQGEAVDESKKLAFTAPDVRGFAYFHQQDAARLCEHNASHGATLYVGYGPIGTFGTSDEYQAANLLIAHLTRDALEDEGLTVEWDGSTASRLAVVDLDWRRPLPEPEAGAEAEAGAGAQPPDDPGD
jgi:hypothetical protein